MKTQLFLIGAVVALSLGALTLADAVPTRTLVSTPQLVAPSPSRTPAQSRIVVATPATSTVTVVADTSPAPTPSTSPGAHPCNHGFYVSQAAHGKHGGAYTSGVARSQLGKNGDCTQPLPAPPASSGSESSREQGGDQAEHQPAEQPEPEAGSD